MKPRIKEKSKVCNRQVFTTDCKSDIEDFYKIRNDIYVNENCYDHQKWQQINHDNSLVIIAKQNDKVVGGARLSFSLDGNLLPDEFEGTEFLYINLLKAAGLNETSAYCQIEDLVMDKGLRDGESVTNIAQLCVDEAKAKGVGYIFFIASAAQCKLYSNYFRKAGCSETRIFNEMIWKKTPEYNFSEDHPALVII